MAAIQAQAMKALAKLEQIDFGALASSITEAADSMKQLTSSPELKKTLEALKTATDKLGSAAISIQNAVDHADQRLDPLIANLRRSSDEANATLRETRATMLDLRSTIQPGSPVMVNLNQALLELAETTRSIGDLTDFLQRNPAALVRGRYVKDEGQ
jgi:paraquat-inducible protein B